MLIKDREVKRMEAHCIYTYEDSIMKPIQHCLKEGEWEYNGGGEHVHMVHCMHIRNYHNEIYLYY
jgi:hypothetical protein